MANREIEKIKLSEDTVRAIRTNYSIRELARQTGVGDRIIRYYLDWKQMPAYLWKKIYPLVRNHIKTKTVWARVGFTIPVTDDELFELCMRSFSGPYVGDVILSEDELKERLAYSFVDGDSYIPECCLELYKEWFEEEKTRRIREKMGVDQKN